MKKYRLLIFIISLGLLIFLIVDLKRSNEKTIKRPTKEFYVNDHENMLLNATKWYIITNGQKFYNDSLKMESVTKEKRGVQIVVVTHIDDGKDIDTTKIFNTYKVGKNDLGIMIFMIFDEDGDFKNLIFEIGIKMSEYLSAFEADGLITNHFYNYGSVSDYDSKIFNLYYHLILVLGSRLYNYSEEIVSFNYLNPYDYSFEQYEYIKAIPSDSFTFNTRQVIIAVFVVISLLGNGGLYIIINVVSSFAGSNTGGGGKSGGYFFRR